MQKIDWTLFISALLLSLIGVSVMIEFSGNSAFAYKQLLWIAVASLVFLTLSLINVNFLKNGRFLLFLFLFVSFLLFLVLFFGADVKGAKSRFYILGFAMQPAEFAKLVLIATLAKYFSRRHLEIAHIKHILISASYALLLFLLVAAQPDLGTGLVILSIWFLVILLSGISKKHLFAMFAIAILSSVFAWSFLLKDYQKDRILVFLNPLHDLQGAGYNAYQSVVAVGSGKIFGKGIGYGTQSKLHFLPEYQTDFIFAAFAEEWGFVGVLLLFTLFGILFARIIHIGIKSNDNYVKLFAVGVFAFLFTHFTVNVGMNIGLLPITGITLPFLSYGGSHLIVEFASLAILSSLNQLRA